MLNYCLHAGMEATSSRQKNKFTVYINKIFWYLREKYFLAYRGTLANGVTYMTNGYEEDLIDEDAACVDEIEEIVDDIELVSKQDPEVDELDARRRLENLLEERRLRDELNDYCD